MKYFILSALLVATLSASAFECFCLGPDAESLTCANFMETPFSFGGMQDGQTHLYLFDGQNWNPNVYGSLPITSITKRDENTMLVSMGCGTYSDGIYNFDLTTHEWTVNYWSYFPNFIVKCCADNYFYFGDHGGLYKCDDGISWEHVDAIGTAPCTGFCCYGPNLITNNGAEVWYSHDCGMSWQQSSALMLKKFRFASDGTLYAILDEGTDSDGLWRSNDAGITWEVVLYTDHLSCIGPDYDAHLVLGWSQFFAESAVALLSPQGDLNYLVHPSLASPARQICVYPEVNTPAFYVVNADGCFFVTGFLNVENNDMAISRPCLDFCVYPNPAVNLVNLKINSGYPSQGELALYNLRGQELAKLGKININKGSIEKQIWLNPNQDLPAGIYFLKLKEASGDRCRKVLLIR